MPIAPITGSLRKRVWIDLSCAMGLGLASGYAYWYGYHLPALARQEAYYIKLEQQRAQATSS